MFDYIIGKIAYLKSNAIVVDNQGIGYLIYVANPFSYEEGKEYKVYTYEHITENEDSLYGFKTLEEKELFLKLISVKGLGPKMTLPILAVGSIDGIKDAIERENILYLKKFPKIGEKLARQIVLDLKGKLEYTSSSNTSEMEKENELEKVNPDLTIEEQVKEALKLLLR